MSAPHNDADQPGRHSLSDQHGDAGTSSDHHGATNAVGTVARRHLLTAPGDGLLLPHGSLLDRHNKIVEFASASGIDHADLVLTSLTSVPLPLYTHRFPQLATAPGGSSTPHGARRWTGTRPEIMWHPLMWLPDRLAGRYLVTDPETGLKTYEDSRSWGVRVGIELTASGLYDVESGWIDILALFGLDAERDRDRVAAWLAGADDEVLDSIDLTEYLTLEPVDWALRDATVLRPLMDQASWAIAADELYDVALSVRQSLDNADAFLGGTSRGAGHRYEDPQIADIRQAGPAAATDMLVMTCLHATAALGAVPLTTEDGVATTPQPTPEAHYAFFDRALKALESGGAGNERTAHAVAAAMADRLLAIREAYWPVLEGLESFSDDDATDEHASASTP